jgi:nucleoside-diphosphate-sugar epimerase
MAQKHWVCDSEALRRDLGWSPAVTIGAGARLTAAWYKEHGWA